MSAPKLLLPQEFVSTATAHINQATDYISFVAMVVNDDNATDVLIDALVAAAKRGVKVQVAVDTFTYGEASGHFLPFKYYTKEARDKTRMVKELKDAGAKFNWLGQFSLLPFTGRTHSKCLVVDDTVYSFGGVNLYDEGLSFTDYMFQIEDTQLALELRDEINRLVVADGKNFSYRSHEFSFKKDSTVLLDGGFQADSIIYRHAYRYAREAKEVLFVSQYCPSGKLGRALKKTKAKLYFNKPSSASFWNKLIIRTGIVFSGHHNSYKRKNYLHAKFIIFTMPNGEKIAITGSHNFMPGSVVFGTKEIALETRDKKIIRQLEAFFAERVA
jgi:cardiolipin synthase